MQQLNVTKLVIKRSEHKVLYEEKREKMNGNQTFRQKAKKKTFIYRTNFKKKISTFSLKILYDHIRIKSK